MSAAFGSAAVIVSGVVAANQASKQLARARQADDQRDPASEALAIVAALTSAKRSTLRLVLSMARRGDITARQVRDSLGVNERSAQRYLVDLVNLGSLTRKGPVVKGATVVYSITEEGLRGL